MGKIRVQPLDIEIPKENPFQNDLLNRQKLIESLTQLVGSIEGPCVMAMDAPWGAGKTTFLKMWSRHLSKQKFAVVEFNAWETDFSEDPFVSLYSELEESLDALDAAKKPQLVKVIDGMKKAAPVVAKHLASNVVRYKTLGILDPDKLSDDLKEQAGEAKRFVEYRDERKALNDFRDKLRKVASELKAQKGSPGPLMIMIDELDRCRPSYAVEFLEIAKHLFAVNQVVFVLAINHKQLAHAVRALYGNNFEAEAYLRRFIDLDIHLPEPNLESFIDKLFVSMGQKDIYWFEKLLKPFFSASSLTLRDIAQAVHRHGLVLNSLPDSNDAVARMTAVALLLRIFNEPLYHQLAKREVTDLEIANKIFDIPPITNRRWTEEGVIFQTGICRAYRQLIDINKQTPLEVEIERRIDDEGDEMVKGALVNAQSIARKLLQYEHPTTPIFRSAYEHTELLFSFIDETSE